MRLLITGATGKVGRSFIDRFLKSDISSGCSVVVLCHNRQLADRDGINVVAGSLADDAAVREAMRDVTNVVHLAAVKESPDLAIDVSVKGLFLLLEQARQLPAFQRFVLLSGDCTVGHIFQRYGEPVTEQSPRKAYPGCYGLTKVLEEVMLEQYQFQYGLDGCVLRAPWIMEKDDFRFALSFGGDQFGGPAWTSLLPANEVEDHARARRFPLMLDSAGSPLKRNFVHADDVVSALLFALEHPAARQSLFNISMNAPVDYAVLAQYLARTRGFESVPVPTPFHSNWLDNSKARLVLGWEPQVDLEALVERAWAYERARDDSRRIWYPG